MIRKTTAEFLIAGLGNPGEEYEQTRHNVGFRALDYLAGASGADVKRLKHYALTGRGTLDGHSLLLIKPQTYMNESGLAVSDAARYYKIPPERLIVLHDDVALPTGAFRIRPEGSPGGHNGLKSIGEHLHTDKYIRFKFGVGSDRNPDYELRDFVLGKMTPSDFTLVSENFPRMMQALKLILSGQLQKAISSCNHNPKKEPPND